MDRARKKGGKLMTCRYCRGEFTPPEKPYVSKQAGMEGEYHWNCFVAACKDRIPVSIGSIDLPIIGTDSEESDIASAPAGVEE